MRLLTISDDHEDWRKEYRYTVYTHKLVGPDGILYARYFIVVKNSFGVIVRFTRLHRYIGIYEGQVVHPLTEDTRNKARYICMMLNYVLLDHYGIYHVDHVFKITYEMLLAFFMDYALSEKKEGGYRGSQSVNKCVSAVTLFMEKLRRAYGSHMVLKHKDLYTDRVVYVKGRRTRRSSPNFTVYTVPEEKKIFRDMPTKVFTILMNLAVRYAPDIAFAMAMQAFAGLRPGEVCNVRQEDSPMGKGLIMTIEDGRTVNVQIDLIRELQMRSDGVVCGRIKKERMQSVYPPFLDVFCYLYGLHKAFLRSHPCEEEYRPMFINRQGMALTYESYYRRFKTLVENHLRPLLMIHSDPECRIYGQLLYENTIAPHVLRHWFSVQLALHGEDVAQLQFWRGDKSPESAFLYLQNKGDLIRELAKTNELLAEMLIREGGGCYE